jgi:hypothetical protein
LKTRPPIITHWGVVEDARAWGPCGRQQLGPCRRHSQVWKIYLKTLWQFRFVVITCEPRTNLHYTCLNMKHLLTVWAFGSAIDFRFSTITGMTVPEPPPRPPRMVIPALPAETMVTNSVGPRTSPFWDTESCMCKICFDTPYERVMIPCGHMICGRCIQDMKAMLTLGGYD